MEQTFRLCMFFVFVTTHFICIATTQHPRTTYIVHMNVSSMPLVFSSPHGWYSATLSSAAETSYNSKLIYTYTKSIEGFSAALSPIEHEAIVKSRGFISSVKDASVELHTTRSYQFLGLNSYDDAGLWARANFGNNVIIGVVDTGVWPESKSFNDDRVAEIPSRWKGKCQDGTQFNSSMCNKKLIGAQYFNKGLIASFPNLNISMDSARDTDGHGTHTSSIAAGSFVEGASLFGYASGIARGIAPLARVAVYKALWNEGSRLSDVLAAIDQAILDGVDVISLSLGATDRIPVYEDPIAIASFRAMQNGIFVSTSAGNYGPGYKTLTNDFPWVLTVAAGTIDREFGGIITLGNGYSSTGLSLYLGNFTSEEISLVFVGACEDENNLKIEAVLHKVVAVCLDTTNVLLKQFKNVQKEELLGGVFVSKYPNNIKALYETYSPNFPALFLDIDEEQRVLEYVKSMHQPRASLTFKITLNGVKSSPKVAIYSSRGPSNTFPFILKPDIMAPGHSILASWSLLAPVAPFKPPLFNNFNIKSGTSMACPHAAAIAALLRAVHPEWTPAAIRSAMMTTAYVFDNNGDPIKDMGSNYQPASPLVMGSGHINPNRAMDPGLLYDVVSSDYVNLLCALNFTSSQIQMIIRSSSYDCSAPSLDLNYPSFVVEFKSNGTRLHEFRRTVTNAGKGMAVYKAEIKLMKGFKVQVEPEILEFSRMYETKTYKMTIERPRSIGKAVVYGSITWAETGGDKHVVTSPIVAICSLGFAVKQAYIFSLSFFFIYCLVLQLLLF